jgi:hypothetical protein
MELYEETPMTSNRLEQCIGWTGRAIVVSAVIMIVLAFAGCAPPAATLGLIRQGEVALMESKKAIDSMGEEIEDKFKAQNAELDAAFDADVHMAAEKDLLDAEWVISARKGYSLARTAIAMEQADHARAVAARKDNVAAGLEALGMAKTIIIMQQDMSANMKQWLMNAENKLFKKEGQ